MSDKETVWKTAITQIQPNHVRVRGYDIADLMTKLSFGGAVYLIVVGQLPSPEIGRLMDALLVSSIDHGATPPSVLAARTAASTGASLSASVAAGILSINRHHGGAIEECARQLNAIVRGTKQTGKNLDEAARASMDEMKKTGRRMSGFGHRIHTADPRTARLFELARQAGVFKDHCEAALAVERFFQAAGKPLPINVDGAIGAILADLEFPYEAMNGIFMIARSPGLVAHVVEEQTREKPMRRIDPEKHAYDGPPVRNL
ncbi:MAG: citryl-CoA lyase [Phycisphaerales bacterium]|nr:citryl-CoA lyase [Phycisphaerales bacterium]MCI0630210.1 citryl-CoA lyase [Phycisphaerales bacterium]MCI0674260.1 citryl-CoA lyase [Phycisphaerales bacterium]